MAFLGAGTKAVAERNEGTKGKETKHHKFSSYFVRDWKRREEGKGGQR